MSKVKFELDRAGVRELMQSNEMMNVCREYAEQVRARAGEGYEASTFVGRNRVNASVRAETFEAIRNNHQYNTLLKALGGGK